MKKIILILLLTLNFSLIAETGKGKTFFIRGVDMSVNSATLKNGLSMQNSLIYNRLAGGTSYLSLPSTNRFNGSGIQVGSATRHNGLLETDFALSFGTLFADSNFNTEFTKSSLTLGTGSSAATLGSTTLLTSEYSSNRLQTANIRLVENVYIFNDSGHKFTEGFSFRFGAEIYGNEVKLKSPYAFGTSDLQLGSTSSQVTGVNGSSIDRITYNEVFLNGVIGVGYVLPIAEGHKISFGYEHLKSLENTGKYKNEAQGLVSFGPTALPITTKIKGDVDTVMVGNRYILGYNFEVSENLSLGINYAETFATHRVVDSKVKEQGNPISLLTGGSPTGFLLSGLNAFGPFPENKDVRKQIGFELVYKY